MTKHERIRRIRVVVGSAHLRCSALISLGRKSMSKALKDT